MVTQSIIRHLLCDDQSLADYFRCIDVSFKNVKRRLLLLERSENKHIPDHFYRMNESHSFEGIDTIEKIITIGLSSLADVYLELRENRIYVKQEAQNQWQGLLPYISPLILQTAFLAEKKPLLFDNDQELKEYYIKYILPNFKYTALPCPYIPQLEHYVKSHKGLHDLHMHLTGTTEMDIVWQTMLCKPQNIHSSEEKVIEQLEQERHDVYGVSDYDMLCEAQKLRSKLFKKAYLPNFCDSLKDPDISFKDSFDSNDKSIYHPLISLFDDYSIDPGQCMPLEALFCVMIFTELRNYGNEFLAQDFHKYLLIQGSFNRLLVQQTHQNGFEQFQKITLNDLRNESEKTFLTRFLQLHGNDSRNIKYLEGRFAPKSTQLENEKLLTDILKGWEQMLHVISENTEVYLESRPQLRLIAHFIKRREDKRDKSIRFKKLRKEIYKKATVLGLMIQNRSPYLENFVGIDAASSEFDSPPEVFAPIFRMLRRCGVKHFTYHAGEDFFHIIGGLRAIYEVIEFNEFKCGDRIGHGTALGVSPDIWIQNIGDKILMKRGDYLDDLVFVYHLISREQNSILNKVLHFIENKINSLYYEIYNKSFPLQVLINSWLYRRYCPMMIFATGEDDLECSATFDQQEWADIQALNIVNTQSDVLEVLKMYHSIQYQQEYDKIIEVSITEFFNIEDLEILQRMMLEILHKKEIVIETLPTSNIRIGIHHDFTTYHLWNWIKWQKEGYSIPPVVIGTDDTGIFSTNIYNEFANIYCHLTSQCKMTHNDVMKIIERLDNNGQIYKFDN